MTATALDRGAIIIGLRDLAAELRDEGEVVGIRLVGGAALALRYFDRGTTQDLDVLHVNPGSDESVAAAAERVAFRRGWDAKWLNFEVTKVDAIPTLGRAVEWEIIHDEGGIVIEVASKEAMLVMKLRANRPGRDTRDIRLLLALCNVHTLEDAGELYEQFYPGDVLTPRAEKIVNAILDGEPTAAPDSPGPIDI
ncbi:hypothetical protein B7495_11065 [Cryobacterium sp. LW097]|uniref:hypothetical protein n=1 Tax=Cryobacterium sp. LW097 TaxID=1978566 RepID=UPI000B4C9E19|nr:hypothetical protein [Cryobacterium sp. LW097]ASD22560.1 hypothetical protein B7495_11065 [Cryobacterium sp. LW097]